MEKKYFEEQYKKCINNANHIYIEQLSFYLYKKVFINCEYNITYINNPSLKQYDWDYHDNIGRIKPLNEIATETNIVNHLKDSTIVYIYDGDYYLFGDDFYIYMYGSTYINIYNESGIAPKWFMDLLVFEKEESLSIKILSGFTKNGITTLDNTIKEVAFNPANYNDDIPTDKINSFIEEKNESGLIILHGNPGCGKSYYIRSLINDHKDINWVFIDSNDFSTLCSNKQYLMGLKNSVLIVEDCEELLTSRENSYNSYVSNLLNIADGLLGDALCIKIICTFNTDLVNIDKALLRKGRIKVKYEFKELTEDKIKNLCKELNIKYNKNYKSLADIYNYSDDSYTDNNDINKIGF